MNKTWIENIILGCLALTLAGFLGAKVYVWNKSEQVALAGGEGGANICGITIDAKTDKFYLINTQKHWIGSYKMNNKTFRMISSRDYLYDLSIPNMEGFKWEQTGVTREEVKKAQKETEKNNTKSH
jgi:hypothetical protein